MANHLITGGGKLVEYAVNKPVRTILLALKADLPGADGWRDHAAIFVLFSLIGFVAQIV